MNALPCFHNEQSEYCQALQRQGRIDVKDEDEMFVDNITVINYANIVFSAQLL